MPADAIEAAAAESELIRDALALSEEAHAGQVRNGSAGLPYIHHPVGVAEVVSEAGFGEEMVAAALLHDVVEDSAATVEQLRERFGGDVADLVAAMTDDSSIESFEERKEEHRRRVAAAGFDALAIYCADKLSNIRVLRRTYAEQGEAVAEEFGTPLDVKVRVWEDDLAMLRAEAPELPYLGELERELALLRAERSERGEG
jgi:(p)ppGpp synthase/HD superfamily hydrolase